MAEIKEYLEKTASLSQAIEGADQDELKRLLAEQKSLNQRMKKAKRSDKRWKKTGDRKKRSPSVERGSG